MPGRETIAVELLHCTRTVSPKVQQTYYVPCYCTVSVLRCYSTVQAVSGKHLDEREAPTEISTTAANYESIIESATA